MDNLLNAWGEPVDRFTDLYGNPVERTPFTHPYNFDQYVIWKSKDFNKNKVYSAEYSDRMIEWDIEKFSRCTQEVFHNQKQYFDDRKPKDIERFLIKYFGHELKLIAIEKCCNFATGYPIWIFHYEDLSQTNK